MKSFNYDVVVIGGGPSGYVAAIKASRLGGKVAIIEKKKFGGCCLNNGCVPAKAFLHNTKVIKDLKRANDNGIIVDPSYSIDINKIMENKEKIIGKLVGGVKKLLESNDVDIFYGEGKITKDKDVEVNGEILKCKKIIVASGSKVNKINIEGINSELVLTSDDIMSIDHIPKKLAVIGGGVIGVEVGQAFSSFGSDVFIIQRGDRIIPGMDRDISEALRQTLEEDGLKVYTDYSLCKVEEKENKEGIILHFTDREPLEADIALLSIGRKCDLSPIENIDLELNRGRIVVNDKMETSDDKIYAVGDVNGYKMLAHAAFKMGEIAAINAMGGNDEVDLSVVPANIYTVPECGMVGLTEEQAREQYDNISIGKFDFKYNPRALATGYTEGFVKVVTNADTKKILGFHLYGFGVGEIINECSVLLNVDLEVPEILNILHGHPTFGEALYEACAHSVGLEINLLKK